MNDEARRLTALYRAEIKRFLEERLQAKLDKLKDDDPKRDTLIAACARVNPCQGQGLGKEVVHATARYLGLYHAARY